MRRLARAVLWTVATLVVWAVFIGYCGAVALLADQQADQGDGTGFLLVLGLGVGVPIFAFVVAIWYEALGD